MGEGKYLGENHQKLAIPAVYVKGGRKEKHLKQEPGVSRNECGEQ
jgi:hypothetical protein